MSQVENLTGIKAHTLRVWERRYAFLKPDRTDTNIRFYSEKQVKKLLNISILQKNGYRISAINKMEDEEIFELVSKILAYHDSEYDNYISALVLSMIEMDEEAFTRIFKNQVFRTGFLATITDLIYPFLISVGGLWISDKTSPAQEHFISNLIRQKIIAEIEAIQSPSPDAPGILIFLTEGENHEIGLLLSQYIAKSMGFRVCYLGQNVPKGNIPEVVQTFNADILFTMFQITKKVQIESTVAFILDHVKRSFLISGNSEILEGVAQKEYVTVLSNPDTLIAYLKNYQKKTLESA